MKLSLHCTCGDSAMGTITPDAKAQRRECCGPAPIRPFKV